MMGGRKITTVRSVLFLRSVMKVAWLLLTLLWKQSPNFYTAIWDKGLQSHSF